MFVREYGYTVTEHDPATPWLILGIQHHMVSLPDGQEFFGWATTEWPPDRFTVELDPWALVPKGPTP